MTEPTPEHSMSDTTTNEIDINAVDQTGVIETPLLPEVPTVPASALFGEDSIGKALAEETRKIGGNQLKRTDDLQRDPTSGKFLPKEGKTTAPAKHKAASVKPPGTTASTPAAPPPPKPAAPAAPAQPATPPAPANIKVGGNEDREDELKALLEPKPAPPAPPPAQPAAPATPQGPSPEEIKTLEAEWVSKNAPNIPIAVDEATVEQIVLGGKDGAKALQTLLQTALARGVLSARQSMFEDLNPVLDQIHSVIAPVQQQFHQMERVAAQHEFFSTYPEFGGNDQDKQLAQDVAEVLIAKHGDWVAKVDRKTFLAEVARQTDRIKEAEFRRWFPNFQGTWKDYQQQQKAAAAAPASAVPAPTPAPPKVRPMGSNSPAPVPSGGDMSKEAQKSIAASLAWG